MKLFDFHEDETFNQQRLTMNHAELGEFELFDPVRHLTWQERQQIEENWVKVDSHLLHANSDKTLAYKNSYVFARTDELYHFSFCDKLNNLLTKGQLVMIDVTLSQLRLQSLSVCEYCLHAVSYQGFDVYRHRHQAYNEKILKSFVLERYLAQKTKS